MRSLGAHAAIGQRELDVLKHGQVADQVEALEDEPDLAVADAGAIREREVRNLGALERVAAARWRVEQAEDGEQGGFAAAGRTGDRDVFALADFEMDSGKRVRFDFIGEEDFRDVLRV